MHRFLAYFVCGCLLLGQNLAVFGPLTQILWSYNAVILCIAIVILNELINGLSTAYPSKQRSPLFPSESNLVVYGGNFVCAGDEVTIRQDSFQTPKGIVEGTRVLSPEDLPLDAEIRRGPGYRMYSSQSGGGVVVVKLYEGRRSQERCLEAAKYSQRVMHPNVLRLFGVSPRNCQLSFLAFHGDYEGSVESRIGLALKQGLEHGLFLGLQTVAGLSSGLNYLSFLNYPFASVGLEHFSLLLSRAGKIVISFDPEVLDSVDTRYRYRACSVDEELVIFHGLCHKTFSDATKVHYESSHQNRRTFADEFNTDMDDLPEDCFEEVEDDLDPRQHLSRGKDSMSNCTTPKLQKPAQKLSPSGHRRELVWKSEAGAVVSLENISREFKDFLDISPSPLSEFCRRRGRYMRRTAHRCPGYQCDKVLLTADIKRSAIVSYLTPTPHEICPVCRQTVRDAQVFNCLCGGDDDESIPNIQCLTCLVWSHRPCVGFLEEAMMESFVCGSCKAEPGFPPEDKTSSEPRNWQQPSVQERLNERGMVEQGSHKFRENEKKDGLVVPSKEKSWRDPDIVVKANQSLGSPLRPKHKQTIILATSKSDFETDGDEDDPMTDHSYKQEQYSRLLDWQAQQAGIRYQGPRTVNPFCRVLSSLSFSSDPDE